LNARRFDPLEIVQVFNRLGVEYVVSLIAQQGTSLEEQAAAMARRAEERLISEQDRPPPPGRRQRDVTAPTKQAAHRQSAESPKLRPPEPSGPSLGQ